MNPVHTARRNLRHRTIVVNSALAVSLVTAAFVSLASGAYARSPIEVLAVLMGQGDTMDRFVIVDLRLPRLLVALIVGVAFAVAGALFQTVLRNPLASPDIIGISGGASAAAVFAIIGLGLTGPAVSVAALLGAAVVAACVYLLASSSGYRFVLIGIGFAFIANSVIGYLLTRGKVEKAQTALVWMVGSLGGASATDVLLLAVTVAPLLVLVAANAPRLRILQLGNETASSLGVNPERTTLATVVLASALIAVATAVVGPIAFLAFVSAPIARRLARTGSLALGTSALVGAVIVLVADFVAQHVLPETVQAPVGVVTGLLGGCYLIRLLSSPDRLSRRS
ncbi:iron chelate uptake ABC transporter family permease subunit [Acrocarpospora macrocephala]|uniref:ABC transporter permease n=1 Tax=Acrocarpospora macrocephala TaxID=150177 RepID=A0A5M3WI63_9ACTN|nr:iron chelate uptake ABC transporter family permease subunit [Acrocarpospora macrocephala]GES08827.1 ABC transporter permease [Acrocarpospora macrocephala]